MRWHLVLALAVATPSLAEVVPPSDADVYLLGEIHDNPDHHREQARLVARIGPGTVVWEMLSPEQAALVPADPRDAAALERLLGWNASGWPDFALYHPIFLAAAGADHAGASVPRDLLAKAMQDGLPSTIGAAEVALWGLGPLPANDQADRESEQKAAHCDALPDEMLPGMVEAQRLRDWALAKAAAEASDAGNGPVVVITGNGHARKDQGVPSLLAHARPDLKVWSLGLTETGASMPAARFDAIASFPPASREDPCLAFRASD